MNLFTTSLVRTALIRTALIRNAVIRNICATACMFLGGAVSTASYAAPQNLITEAFKEYWYTGKAEIASYELKQARYGELHEGTAVLIYVTEPFLPNVQVKADYDRPSNVSVLKLNATKKFLTGIYPYSIIASTFFPISSTLGDKDHAIKVAASTQEWCGHSYTQINNRDAFEINSHSYFEGEADQQLSLPKGHLENELWTKIRLSPDDLPTGNFSMVPSLEYIRLRHREIKAYKAVGALLKSSHDEKSNVPIYTYVLDYPELARRLEIDFSSEFPYEIEGWRETYKSGFGPDAKELTTVATKMNTIKSDYWNQKNNTHRTLRKDLGL